MSSVEPEQEELLNLLSKLLELGALVEGFVSASLHRSLDGTKVRCMHSGGVSRITGDAKQSDGFLTESLPRAVRARDV